jgi:hypothetical protein
MRDSNPYHEHEDEFEDFCMKSYTSQEEDSDIFKNLTKKFFCLFS